MFPLLLTSLLQEQCPWLRKRNHQLAHELESVIDPFIYSSDSKSFGGSAKFKTWLTSMDTISDYLAFSQILESGPINASLSITGLSLSNNNISFYISWMFVRVLSNLCGSAAHLFEDSTILTNCTILPLTYLQETIFFKTHCS